MQRIITNLAFSLLLGFSAHAFSADLTKTIIVYKDIQFGKPGEMQKLKQKCLASTEFRSPDDCSTKPNTADFGLDDLRFSDTFGPREGPVLFTKGPDDSLIGVNVFFVSSYLPAYIDSLTAKYGQPDVKPFVVVLKSGQTATRELLTWTDSRGTVMTLRTAVDTPQMKNDVEFGRIRIESVQLRAIKEKINAASAIKDNL